MKRVPRDYITATDEVLMKLSGEGNRPAFEALYDRYFTRLTGFARQYVYDNHLAEDIVQEVFIKIIERPELFNGEKKFSTWVYTITANRCKNMLRDTKNRSDLVNSRDTTQHTDLHHHIDYNHMRRKINDCYSALSEKEKTLFVLRFEHELPIKDIAEITAIPEGSVKSGIFYLLKKMSDHLKVFTHGK